MVSLFVFEDVFYQNPVIRIHQVVTHAHVIGVVVVGVGILAVSWSCECADIFPE